MDQSKVEQMLEHLMAMRDKVEAGMDASPEIMKEPLKASLVGLDKCIEMIKAEMKAKHQKMMAKMDAWLGETKSSPGAMEACEERTEACLEEEKEPAPEETEAVAEARKVPEGATDEETRGGTEDRTGEQRLAVRRHSQQKKRAQVNNGPGRSLPPPADGLPAAPSLHCTRDMFVRYQAGYSAAG
jgi:hypothetical protein